MGRAVMSLVATSTYDSHGIEVPATIGAGCALLVIVCLWVHSRVTRVVV